MADTRPLNVLVWDENPRHAPKELYPENLRGAIADGLRELSGEGELTVTPIHLDEPDQGVPEGMLEAADVLVWWGHARHGEVEDALAERVKRQVHERGLGFICLHSGHYSKTFKAVLGATGDLKGGWRESTDSEAIRVCAPWHPIAEGIEDFTLPNEEMYGAPFGVPSPLEVIFQSRFSVDGATFPSGLVWTVGEGIDPEFQSGKGNAHNQGEGKGRVFYFRPGHETYPTYYNDSVKRVILNAVRWVGRKS